MKFKRGLAVLLAALLLIPTLPVSAEESAAAESAVTEEVQPEEEGLSTSETEETQEAEEEESEASEAAEGEEIPPESGEEADASETAEGEEALPESGEEANDSNDNGAGEELTVPENSETEESLPETEVEEILFNTGNHVWSVVDQDTFFRDEVGDAYFEEDGSYTINIPEENPFFPYEVQFTYEGEVTNQWFMTPEDSVEIGGHTFHVSAYIDGTVMTQMSLNVAGDTVIVYPEEKEFTNDGEGAEELSLLPLEEKSLRVDLSAYTPAELTMVSVSAILGDAVADSDRVIWTYRGYDDYTISESGSCVNLSYRTYYSSSTQWEMIAGTADQLDAENIRYMVTVQVTPSRNWLIPMIYTQDEMGTRTALTVISNSGFDDSWTERYDRRMSVYVSYDEMGSETQAYISLAVNPAVFSGTRYASMRAYEGEFSTMEEAVAGTDITDQLFCTDMTQTNAGYLIKRGSSQWITMVTFDESGTPTGCMPVRLYFSTDRNYISIYDLYAATENGQEDVTDYRSSRTIDGCIYYTITLYAGYADNGTYYECMSYYKEGSSSNSDVTGAYVGLYDSIAEAVSAGARDIKGSLFNSSYSGGGYPADYSQGVFFTIFVGEDGIESQEVYHYCIIAVEGTNPKANSGSSITFSGLCDSDGKSVASYRVKTGSGSDSDDSYAEFNYITLLVGEEADVTSLAPVFSTSSGAKVYTAGSSSPEESGVSLHDFSNGPVQYSVASEDGNNSQNCWLQVVKATDGAGWLYVNSLADSTSNTKVENGVIYSTREVMLDSYHNNLHDILLVNMGTEAIPNLSVELVSDVVKLDDYWTLRGNHELAGFSTTYRSESNGELPNLAKLRITAINGVTANEVSGTLTIKSGDTHLMVLNLTGVLGDPSITTEELPQNIVKYVPYGTMIQDNNKYSWNKTSYSLISGTLPAGMEVRPSGEVYGIPTETGEFIFTVRMTNSYNSFTSSTRTYTLNVMENTDLNVDGATDTGYDLTQRVQDIYLGSTPEGESQTLVSVGIYGEFVDIYLDGIKLVEGMDYDSESGSTRITIRNQTLALTGAESAGTHTLGIEFRTQDDDNTLKRAAQNYVIHVEDDSEDEDDTNSDNDGSDSAGNGNSGSNNGNVSGNAVILIDGVTTISYTVVSGDTLWKIAQQYYGSGAYWQKLYEDNADTISDPNKIYAGQKLTIYLIQVNTAEPAVDGNTYTVASGDTLWKIAQKIYGKGKYWRKIYNANTDIIADPERIYVGQVLVIPED